MEKNNKVEPLQNGEREYSKNERAEKLVGKRMADGIIIDFPAELDYHCPVCKYEQENSEGNYDERLDWSEYNGFIYCHKCNKDYPSCLCMPDKEKAIKIYLDCIEDLLSQSKKEGITIGYKKGYEDACKMYNMPLNMTYEWIKDVDTSEWV